MPHGGKREGAGRKRDPTAVIRLKLKIAEWLKANPAILKALASESFRKKVEDMAHEHQTGSTD